MRHVIALFMTEHTGLRARVVLQQLLAVVVCFLFVAGCEGLKHQRSQCNHVDVGKLSKAIAARESGQEYARVSHRTGKSGAYMFSDKTWAALGGRTARAAAASEAEQDAVAMAYLGSLLLETGCDEHRAAAAWNPDAYAATLGGTKGTAKGEL